MNERIKKFDDKGEPMMFLGYHSKGTIYIGLASSDNTNSLQIKELEWNVVMEEE